MDLGLKGKSAVVTGGNKGIGRAIAEALLSDRRQFTQPRDRITKAGTISCAHSFRPSDGKILCC